MSEKQTIGINQRIEEINNKFNEVNDKISILANMDELERKKKFKIKGSVRSKLKKLAKNGQVLVFLLKINRTILPTIAKIHNNTIMIDGKYHECSTDFVFLYEGKYPSIVLPEWSLIPIGTNDFYEAEKDGRRIDAEEVIIKAIEARKDDFKPKISGKMLIWVLVGVIIVFYLIFANSGGVPT